MFPKLIFHLPAGVVNICFIARLCSNSEEMRIWWTVSNVSLITRLLLCISVESIPNNKLENTLLSCC